jgi:hypothetical protein
VTATVRPGSSALQVSVILLILAMTAVAQSPRERIRLPPDRSTPVTESQAGELTLTLTEAAPRPIQIWVRTAGVIDASRTLITASVSAADGARIRVGQRVRAFPPASRSSMSQARVTRVDRDGDRLRVSAQLASAGRKDSTHYVLEIVTEEGEYLSVPNEAIIETGGTRIVYVQEEPGRYAPREIQPGIQGELYTQVLAGLERGEQVVTIGSFFIDAEHKLKGP